MKIISCKPKGKIKNHKEMLDSNKLLLAETLNNFTERCNSLSLDK